MAQAITAPRHELHSVTDWKAGAWAGVIAGLVFVMLEMGMVWMIQGQSPWGPPHMMAAMALGKEVLPPPGTWAPFDVKIMLTAMMIHLPLSIALGLIGAWLMHRFDWAGGLMIGAGLGLASTSSISTPSLRRRSRGSRWGATGSAPSATSCSARSSGSPTLR